MPMFTSNNVAAGLLLRLVNVKYDYTRGTAVICWKIFEPREVGVRCTGYEWVNVARQKRKTYLRDLIRSLEGAHK